MSIAFDEKTFNEKMKKAERLHFDVDARLSRNSINELVRVGAINKKYVVEGLTQPGDLYLSICTKLEDIFIIADTFGLESVIDEIVISNKKLWSKQE